MKKFTSIFMAVAILFSLTGSLPAAASTDSSPICSGYYGINRSDGVIGPVTPSTEESTFLSRILISGQLALSGGVATGSELTLSRDDMVIDKLSLVVQADCSGDGQFSVTDMLMVKSHILNKTLLEGIQGQAADTNGDHGISVTDFIQIKAHILGKSQIEPK